MKNIIVAFFISTMILGCNSTKQEIKSENNELESIDTILIRSEKNFVTVNRINQKSDSSISNKVNKTVKQINTLKEEVKQLKEENNELKTKINDANDAGKPFQLLPVSNGKDNR
jgi:uncharacterized coiled-coil DUF342 family protein